MSRSGIPGNKTGEFEVGMKQVCIYGFPKEALAAFSSAGEKTPLENMMKLRTAFLAVADPEVWRLHAWVTLPIDRLRPVGASALSG